MAAAVFAALCAATLLLFPSCDGDYSVAEDDELCALVECLEGEQCVDGACLPVDPARPCVDDVDCGEGWVCDDGVCTPDSEEDRCASVSCDEGEQCVDGACIIDDPGPICLVDEGCVPGDVCNNGVCIPEPVSELALENPGIDFSDLFVGLGYELVAPDPSEPDDESEIVPDAEAEDESPGEAAMRTTATPAQRAAPPECACQWSVTPTSYAHFSSIDQCTTEMTPDAGGEFTISVTVACEDVSGKFTESAIASVLPTSCSTNEECNDDEVCVDGVCTLRTGPVVTVLAELPRQPFVVAFDIRLEDIEGNPVHENVLREQFHIFEDNIEIDYAETAYSVTPAPNLPLKIVLVLDYTVSMANAGAVESMVTAAQQFVQAEHFTATHDIGVVEFHDRTGQGEGYSTVVPLTTADAAGKSAIAQAIPAAGTLEPGMSRVWDAVDLAVTMLGEMERQPGEVHAIVFLTDGKDTTSEASSESILSSGQASNIKLYPIGFGDVTATESLLQSLADETRGAYFPALSSDELTEVFAEVARDLRGQWLLRYITQRNDGTLRVRIEFDSGGQAASFEADVNVGNIQGDIHAAVVEVLDRRYDETTDATNFVLKAAYLPRNISQFRFFVAQNDSTMTLQEAGGLTPPGAGWVVNAANETYNLLGPGPLEYGSFGNIGVVTLPGDVAQLQIAHDDTIYDALPQPKTVAFEGDAYLAPAELTVAIEPPEGGLVGVNPSKVAYAQGETVSLMARALGDHAFQTWEGDATGSEITTTVTMHGDQAVTARFYPAIDTARS
ncbi:MAG: VWA domain-containing protein [Planctomycetota bacterium]